jgi:hypothetical protein
MFLLDIFQGMVPGFHNPHFIPGPATANVQIHIRPTTDVSQPMPRLPWRPLETVTCFKVIALINCSNVSSNAGIIMLSFVL